MPLDAGIYSNVGRGVKSVQDYDLERANLQGVQQGNQINALNLLTGQQKYDEGQRAIQRQGALRALAGTWGADTTDDQRIQGLKNAGFFNEADALDKSLQERQKTASESKLKNAQADEAILKQFSTKLEQHQKLWGSVTTPDQAAQLVQAAWSDPSMAALMKAKGGDLQSQLANIPKDPTQFQNYVLGQSKGLDELLKYTRPDANAQLTATTSAANNAATNERMAKEAAAGRAVTMRGQDMTDARARETQSAAVTKPFEVTGPDGLPMLVRQDKQGNITPVEGYGPKSGSAKPLNDTQAKALLFGSRMRDADKVLTDLAAKGNELPSITKRAAGAVPLIGGALAMGANKYVASPEQQQVEQAQRDFVNAVLRRESGAAIAESEFENARKQYFPEVGDSPAVKEQKSKNRKLATEGLLAEVPEGRRQSIGTGKDAPNSAKQVKRTGMLNGKKVTEYTDGTVEVAN